jgi:Hsp20/alpha crystallin family
VESVEDFPFVGSNPRARRDAGPLGFSLRPANLPEGTASDKTNAEFKDGVLKLHLPKDEKAKTKTVDVKIG